MGNGDISLPGRDEKVTIGQVVNDDYREKATMRMKTRMEGRTKVWTTGQSDGWMDGYRLFLDMLWQKWWQRRQQHQQ